MHTTMATENNNKNLNVPNLRFPEFSGEWDRIKVSDLLEFYPTNSLSWEQLEYSDEGIFNLHYGLIHKGLPTQVDVSVNSLPTIKEEFIPKKISLCQNGDVAFADASEDTNDVAKCIEFANCEGQKIVCGLHTIHGRDKQNKTVTGYKGYAFSARAFREQIRRLAQGTKIYSISSGNFSECYIGIPSKAEQSKIANLLLAVDQRIATQIKIIEKLESLIKGLCQKLFRFDECTTYFLGNICSITTGKLDANAMVENGKYPFFTCAEEVFNIDNYAFDTEALLISGNGANLGYIHYYNGKFNAYQRTYVLDKFTIDINYIRLYLETFLKNRIEQEKNIGNTPYIVLGTLSKMKIKVPNILTQQKIVKALTSFKNKLSNERLALKKYEEQKKYLLSNLFI